jgi:hypothetical protein
MGLPKFRRFYFPGLISLIFLPLFIIGYFMFNGTFNRFSAMKVVWTNDESVGEFLNCKQCNIKHFRKFDDEVLTGNEDSNKVLIARLEKKVHYLKSTTDTNTAYSITFSSKARYSDIVKVIDICEHCDAKDYGFILYKNKALIWKATSYAPNKVPTLDHIAAFGDDVLPMEPTPYDKFVKKVTVFGKYFASYWPSALILVPMIWFGVVKRKRYLDLRTFKLSDHDSSV